MGAVCCTILVSQTDMEDFSWGPFTHVERSTYGSSAGSGYLAACMGVMVAPNGHVLGIEQHEPLAQRSIASIRCAAFLLCSYPPFHVGAVCTASNAISSPL